MTTENQCGTCTACCRVYAIPELGKPAGAWCDHCDVGKGCKVYATRPARCAEFECLWLQSQRQQRVQLSAELRPDRCKVVFIPSTNDRVMTATTMPGAPDAWQRPAVRALIDRFLRGGIAVAIGTPQGRTQTVLRPDGRQQQVRMTAPDENGMQWSIDLDARP